MQANQPHEININDVYNSIKSLFISVKREYYTDPKYGRQIGNIDAILPPIKINDIEYDLRVRFCFIVKWSNEVLPSGKQSICLSIRETDEDFPKGNSDLYDWTTCDFMENVSLDYMIKFSQAFTEKFGKKKDVIIKLLQEGKKSSSIMKVFIKSVIESIKN